MRRFVDWFFRDRRTGRIVIGQWPNTPLWLFAVATALAWSIQAAGWAGTDAFVVGLRILASVSLAWWALDELVRGVNPWRRCLGGAVLLYGAWSLAGRV